MNFQYKVRDAVGETSEGSIEAESQEDATQQLHSNGYQVLSLEEDYGGTGLFARPVKQVEIIYTTSQLSIMVDTGITLSAALAGIADQAENPSLRRILSDLKTRVEGGEDFSTALERHPKHFDKTFIALVKASEQTGALGEMLERIACYLRNQLENRSKVRAAMAYPGVMLFMAISVTTFLLTFVMPKFTPIFKSKGVKLPLPTKVILFLSDALLGYWYLWLLGISALLFSYFYLGKKTEPGRKIVDGLRLNLPILGPMFRKVALSRSISTLGTMLASGVSMLESLRLCAEVSGNYWYEKKWLEVLDQVTQGNRVADSLKDSKLFPKTLVQMMSSGEETGRLDFVLQKVSGYYDREVETALKAATSMIEPIMICAMGVVVGGIGMGIMLPIFSLSRAGH